ncbi:MAG: hypothetical protein M2R45_00669 [Verrucomicrobia subdivision 3 bacterium]|nr:hypothetical protein [Limisphaerales bacterium]MCS1414447.1 hypothetical protein [Limisphaerales bacterium]
MKFLMAAIFIAAALMICAEDRPALHDYPPSKNIDEEATSPREFMRAMFF